ncbi:MAG: DUF2933 domain-containing protein [Thermodesulfobacteriota bacterium]
MEQTTLPAWLNRLLAPNRLPWLVLAMLGGGLLIYWGGPRLWSLAPFGLFLLCPLMHLFMHRDHDHGGGHACATHGPAQEKTEQTRGPSHG